MDRLSASTMMSAIRDTCAHSGLLYSHAYFLSWTMHMTEAMLKLTPFSI